MSNVGPSGFKLTTTKIMVEGAESNLIFNNLVIHQAIADVNSFSFIWREPAGEPSMSNYVSFYQKYLSKSVTIKVGDYVSVKGLITSINCVQGDELGVHYEVNGKGLFAKLDETAECNSFSKKSIKDIFTALNTAGLPLKLAPASSQELFYTVQYNQTTFDFYRMMAIRHGEWLYDDGAELVLGPPDKKASASLRTGTDLDNVSFSVQIRKASILSKGFDQRKGDSLEANTPANVGASAAMTKASIKGGEVAFPSQTNGISIPHITDRQMHSKVNELHNHGVAAAAVYMSAHSYSSRLKLGCRIEVQDAKGGASGEYVITEIHHFCSTNNNYENQFSAVPAEVEAPPYTDPFLYPRCKTQPAIVTNNEDTDGLDRIKVHFPWQNASETSPWINVLMPHAGKGKGFRFLPETGEEVVIGFIDDNAEKPFFMGAIHTEKTKSADPEVKNNLKAIGTRSDRRLEMDDDKGIMLFADSRPKSGDRNALTLERKDATVTLKLNSGKDDNNYSAVNMTNQDLAEFVLFKGGTAAAEIKLMRQGDKIIIHAMGDIEIKADKDITMEAMNITINAKQELKVEGKMGVTMKGLKMALTADTTMNVKGIETTVAGEATVELKASGIASVVGAMVKIN